MASQTYYSSFFPATEDLGKKGTTIAVVPSQVVGAINDSIGAVAGHISSIDQQLLDFDQKIKDAIDANTGDLIAPDAITGLTASSDLTDAGSNLVYSWNASAASDFAGYVLAIKEGSGTYVEFLTTSPNYKVMAAPRNRTFTAKVLAYDTSGNRSPWSPEVGYTTARDTVPPATVANILAEASFNTAFITWLNPSDSDLANVRVDLVKTTTGASIQVLNVNVIPSTKGTVTFSGLEKATTYVVRITAYDTSNNASQTLESGVFTTAGGVNLADFTPGLSPTQTVSSLPNPSGYTGAVIVFNQADGKLYRYNNGAWTSAISADDIPQNAITTEKLVDGVVTSNKVGFTIGGGNLVRNSSMENATWQTGIGPMAGGFAPYSNTDDGAVDYDIQANGRNGGKAQLVRWTKNTSVKGLYLVDVAGVNNLGIMRPNSKYVFTFYTLGAGTAQGSGFTLAWNINPNICIPRKNPVANGTWLRYEFYIETGANVDTNIFITTQYQGPNPGYFYIDDIQLEEGTVATAYAPALLSGEITGNLIAPLAIDTSKLIDGAITDVKIASISAPKLTGQLTNEQLASIAAAKLTGQITETQITDNSISTVKIKASAITANEIAAGAIIAEKISASQITTEKLAAGSITADKLTIGVRGQNLLINGSGEARNTSGWGLTEGYGAPQTVLIAGSAPGPATLFVNKQTSGDIAAYAPKAIPVIPGHTYVARMNYWGSVATPSGLYFRMYAGTTEDSTNSGYNYNLGFENVAVSVDPNKLYEAIWVCPAGVYWARPAIYSWSGGPTGVAWRNVEMFEQVTSAVIADGAVTTNKMIANTIIGDRIKAGTLAADKIVADSITADQIAANAITANEISADAVTANKIAVNAITARAIAASAITADKILIKSTGGSLNADPNFVDTSVWPVFTTPGASFETITYGIAGTSALRLQSSGTAIVSNERIPVDPLKQYRFRVWAMRASGTVGGIFAGVVLYDANGANIGGDGTFWKYVASASQPTGAWTKYEASFGSSVPGYEFPANARTMAICLFGNYDLGGGADSIHQFQDVRIEEVLGSTLIANGAITTDKMVANSISGDRIATNTLSADRIVSNSVTAGKLSIQTKPISLAGVNLRWDNDNVVRWDNGTITYPDTNGSYITKTVTAGALGWNAGWTNPVNLCFNSDLTSSGLGYVYYGFDLINFPQMIVCGTWNSSGSDFVVKSGVSTLVTGDRIVTGSIHATKIVANSITSGQIAAGSIVADRIQAGTITAAQIAAGAINASKLLVSSMTNLNPDPGFRDTTYWYNNGVYNGPLGTSAGSAGAGWYNSHGSDINDAMGTTQYVMLWSEYMPGSGRQHLFSNTRANIRGGATYSLSAYGRNASNQVIYVYLRYFDVNAGFISDSAITWGPGEVGNKSIQVVAPSNTNSYQFIVFNQSGFNFSGNAQVANLQVVEAVGATTIMNGAVTTDKMVANSILGDRIQAGTLSADKIAANTVMSNTITVLGTSGNIGDAVVKANAADIAIANITSDNILSKSEKSELISRWQSIVQQWTYVRDASSALGLSFVDLDNSKNNLSAYLSSISPGWSDTSTDSPFDGAYLRTLFENLAANIAERTRTNSNTAAARAQWGGVSGAGKPADNATVGAPAGTIVGNQFAENVSAWALDPAPRVNANTTQIDPGRILISGGTSLANWRFGGDTTLIGGGSIAANTIAANKLTIGNRGLSVLGVTFRWDPTNNYIYWTEGYFYYQGDGNEPIQRYIYAGDSGGQGAHMYFYWTKDSSTITLSREVIMNDNTVMVASWWGGSNLNVNFGNTIINGDRIVTNTIQANKIVAGTITATQIAGGTITGDRIAATTIDASKLSVGSLSAITANIGLLRTATSGARTEIENNQIRVYDNNNVLRVRMGIW